MITHMEMKIISCNSRPICGHLGVVLESLYYSQTATVDFLTLSKKGRGLRAVYRHLSPVRDGLSVRAELMLTDEVLQPHYHHPEPGVGGNNKLLLQKFQKTSFVWAFIVTSKGPKSPLVPLSAAGNVQEIRKNRRFL